MKKPAVLLLEDGTLFNGFNFGYDGETTGECCFNSSMTGYQEIITDPSYAGQVVTMTYTMIGNYGTNSEDMESAAPKMRGLVVREYSQHYENWRAETSLDKFLLKHKITGIEGVDTRKLTRHIRDKGTMRCIISSTDLDKKSLLAKVQAVPQTLDLVSKTTAKKPYVFSEKGKYSVVAYDLGVKQSLLHTLAAQDCAVTVVPASASAEEILAQKPDGIFLTSGPGDPSAASCAIENTKKLLDSNVPILGVGLGLQIIALALGAKTFKLKYGHRSGQPVQDAATGHVEITAQNHSFAVDPDSLSGVPVDITHINLNDKTIEGIAHKTKPVFAVQQHSDTGSFFAQFAKTMEKAKKKK